MPTVEDIRTASIPSYPSHQQRIGSTTVSWTKTAPGHALVWSEGGSPVDRTFAEQLVTTRLAAFNLARQEIDTEGFHKEAAWPDIEQKAKRLILNNQVNVIRNGYNNIVGHVIGDHGEYSVEIGRQDPSSRSISDWTCFLPEAPVLMADGTTTPISEIELGDRVITHLGNIRSVTNRWDKPYDGLLAKIKLKGIDEQIVATDDHRFFVSNEDYYLEDLAGWRGRKKSTADGPEDLVPTIGWIEAKNVPVGGYLSAPSLVTEEASEIGGVPLDEDLATFLGWYAAEGYIVSSRPNGFGLNLHLKELPVAEWISDLLSKRFQVPGNIRTMTWPSEERMDMIEFRAYSGEIRSLVEKLGIGSGNKRVPVEILNASRPVREAFLEGYLSGDGCIDGKRASISTVSRDMVSSIRLLLDGLGIASACSFDDNNDGNGFVKNFRRIYRVRWSLSDNRRPSRFHKEGFSWYQVESVDYEPYSGMVYDIEVEGDHSFVAYGVAAHNCECPWGQFAWGRTRQWKKYEGRPCSHTMALYWKSLATPLDDYDEEQHGPLDPGQKMGPPTPPPAGAPPAAPPPGQRSFGPDDMPPAPMGPDVPIAPPGEPLPMSPAEQFAQMQPPEPGSTPAGMPAPNQSVSVPGARQPSPGNPTQFPGAPGVGGTLSKVAGMTLNQEKKAWEPLSENFLKDSEEVHRYPNDWSIRRLDDEGRGMDAVGQMLRNCWQGRKRDRDAHTLLDEHGIPRLCWHVKKDFDTQRQGLSEIRGRNNNNIDEAYYDMLNEWASLNGYNMGDKNLYTFHPDNLYRKHVEKVLSDPNWDSEYEDDPEFQAELRNHYDIDGNLARPPWTIKQASAPTFEPPEIVRTLTAVTGVAEGKSDEHGNGQWREVPAGSTGEVLGQDPMFGWVECIFPLDGGELTPYHVRVFCNPNDLQKTRIRPPGPFTKRR